MRPALLLIPLLALACNDEFDPGDDNEGLNPLGDSWDLTIRASGWDAWDGRRAGVALWNPGEDDLEARSDDIIIDGRFEFFMDDELEDDEDYQLHYHIDFNGDDECQASEVFVTDFIARDDMLLSLPAGERVGGGSCDLVWFDFL